MLTVRKILKVVLRIFLTLAGLAAIAGGIFIYILGRSFDSATQPVTDISRYQEIRRQFEPDLLLVKHFPNQIPNDAKNVRLYFLPGFLQGGTIFQLRMKLPAEKIKKIQAEFRKSAQRKYIPGSKTNSPKEEISPKGVAITYEYKSYTGESSNQTFPPNYEILVLKDTRGAPEYDWNHPESYGVAIDVSASEIIYWAEDW